MANKDNNPFKKIGKGGAWSLSAMLDIPEEENISVTLLRAIKNTPLGDTVRNPTTTGAKTVKVTPKLKQKAVFAYNAKTKFKK